MTIPASRRAGDALGERLGMAAVLEFVGGGGMARGAGCPGQPGGMRQRRGVRVARHARYAGMNAALEAFGRDIKPALISARRNRLTRRNDHANAEVLIGVGGDTRLSVALKTAHVVARLSR